MTKLLAVLILAAIPASAAPHINVDSAKALTVLVTNEGFLGRGRGSGILLDSTHVLTCAHMVETPSDELFVYTYPLGKVVKAHAEFIDVADDIMLLVLDSSVPVSSPPVFQVTYHDGDSTTVIGNALGSMKWIVSRGIISGSERDYLLTDAHVNPGNSGGPWFNERGEIVAMTDWGIGPNQDKHYIGIDGGISAKKIEEVLAGYKNGKAMMDKLLSLLGGAK